MRLHRLVLSNYRGITHREIHFAERGVTVVSGPNEVGKSSMIEALDLLLESKDRSSKKDVKQVKPTHADVGSEVTAEISTGGYRFVYRKRFHKKCETELTILAPQREQLTGDEAHDRVRSMLAETVDTGLWQAQRILQAASTAAVDLSACDALSRALDVAAGDAAELTGLSGNEPLLVEKIDAEYARYFTGTGRATGEWSAALSALAAADGEVIECTAAVTDVDERVRRHAEFAAQLTELDGSHHQLATRLQAAEQAAGAVDALADELRGTQIEAAAASATSVAAAAAHRERLRLRAEVGTRAEAVTAAEVAAVDAVATAATGVDVRSAAEHLAEYATTAMQEAQGRAEAARRAVAELADREEIDRLVNRLARVDTVQSGLDRVGVALRDIHLTGRAFQEIETASAAAQLAEAQVAATAPVVQFTAECDIVLQIGGLGVPVLAGQCHELTVADATAIGVPGIGTFSITPGATGAGVGAQHAAAQRVLVELLAGSGAGSLDEARRIDAARRELLSERDQLTASLSGLLGDDTAADLRGRLDLLRGNRLPTAVLDAAAVRADLAAAEAACGLAVRDCETQREVLAAAVKQSAERHTAATVLQAKAADARMEHLAVRDRLSAQQAEAGDDELAVRARMAADEAERTSAHVAVVTARLSQAEPDAVRAEANAARGAAELLGKRHAEVEQALHDIEVELSLIGTEGRAGKLNAALVRQEHAAAEHSRVQGRARAARTLREVIGRHRDDTRLRYVEPFRTELERLGRNVFGVTFEVEVDSNLQIRNRTLNGCTVPFESLSGGAREQLGILARLAVAALVDTQDAVPVMIDDALGFSDPERLAKMGAVFDTVGSDGQVIVLTCVADRYRGVAAAHTVELTAS